MSDAIRIAHALSGRLRVRVRGLRRRRDALESAAEELASLSGMLRVTARPATGSLLCEYDPETLGETALVAAVRRATGASRVAAADEPDRPEPGPGTARAAGEGAAVARAVARAFREMNEDILAATDGRLDMGSLAAVSFVVAGAAEVATTRRLPAPPWFNLAWWAFRTFTELEQSAMRSEQSHASAARTKKVASSRRATQARKGRGKDRPGARSGGAPGGSSAAATSPPRCERR